MAREAFQRRAVALWWARWVFVALRIEDSKAVSEVYWIDAGVGVVVIVAGVDGEVEEEGGEEVAAAAV